MTKNCASTKASTNALPTKRCLNTFGECYSAPTRSQFEILCFVYHSLTSCVNSKEIWHTLSKPSGFCCLDNNVFKQWVVLSMRVHIKNYLFAFAHCSWDFSVRVMWVKCQECICRFVGMLESFIVHYHCISCFMIPPPPPFLTQ